MTDQLTPQAMVARQNVERKVRVIAGHLERTKRAYRRVGVDIAAAQLDRETERRLRDALVSASVANEVIGHLLATGKLNP